RRFELMGYIRKKLPPESFLFFQPVYFFLLLLCPIPYLLLNIINRIIAHLLTQRLFEVFAQLQVMDEFINELDFTVNITLKQIIESEEADGERDDKRNNEMLQAMLKIKIHA